MKVLSLFSGVGGFDLGFERAGMTISACCEIDPAARKVLERRFPGAEIFPDVTELDGRRFEGAIDIVCGGFPCQDLSVAGRRAGLAGGRSGLFYEACRIIGQSRPKWIVLENVPGLLSSNGGRDMLAVLRGLAELGYVGTYRVLDSQYFGVAQRRRRVFIVGHLAGPGAERAGRVLFEPESLRRDSPPSQEAREDIAGTLEARDRCGGFRYVNESVGIVETDQAASLRASGATTDERSVGAYVVGFDPQASATNAMQVFDDLSPTLTRGRVAGTLSANCGGLNRPAGNANKADFCIPVLAPTLQSGGGGNATNGQVSGDWRDKAIIPVAMRGRGDAYDLECAEGPANGLRAGKAGMVGGRHMVRRLTPVECERLQGFPDGWTEGHSKTIRYRFMGNAVTVNVAEWIGRRIMEVSA